MSRSPESDGIATTTSSSLPGKAHSDTVRLFGQEAQSAKPSISPVLLEGSPPDNQQFTRHADLWFRDGSVILCANTVLFRVHMTQLARHSELFRDLFSLPQPCAPTLTQVDFLEQVKDVPFVRLYDDPDDVVSLLRALYDGPTFGDNSRDDFRVVSGILRLSTKYLIEGLRAKALAHLSIAWPSTLKDWDSREETARSWELDNSSHGGLFYPSPIDVINLARDIGASSLLWSAFYDLSRYHYTQIFEPNDDEPLYIHQRAGKAFLSTADLRKLTLGKEAIHQAVISLIQGMARSPFRESGPVYHQTRSVNSRIAHYRNASGRGCISSAACRKDFSDLVELATQHYLIDRERGCADPLYVAEELGQLKSTEVSDCKSCAHTLEMWAQKERERLWKLIPLWFRLEA